MIWLFTETPQEMWILASDWLVIPGIDEASLLQSRAYLKTSKLRENPFQGVRLIAAV